MLDENDAVAIESQGHNMEVEPATESNNDVATEAQTVNDPTFMIRMPTHRQVTSEKLEAEADSIYAGLLMLEDKCKEIHNHHTSSPSDLVEGQRTISYDSKQWAALVRLHHTLLEEHHDFVFVSRHPSASASLKELAAERTVPERMWNHAIHSFLEIMRKRLFESREFMNCFIILAYHMVSCLDGTFPLLSWIEYKADLARYV